MKIYRHPTLDEREYLEKSLKTGKSLRQIAAALGRSPSTISREIKRNQSAAEPAPYNHWKAEKGYKHRRQQCHRRNNLTKNPSAFAFILKKLLEFWSPEIIAGRWNRENADQISLRSIYRAVRAGLFPGVRPTTHFRRKGRLYANQKKSYAQYCEPSIHDREEIINLRGRFGDFEGDTVFGSTGKGFLVTAIDRKSRFLVATIASDKSAAATNAAFKRAFAREKLLKPLTLTLDNGAEFLAFRQLEQDTGVKVYFADSHAPWQRGSNENINGLIRFFFPRGTGFSTVTDIQLEAVLRLINNRPRKCLGYMSPYEVLRLA